MDTPQTQAEIEEQVYLSLMAEIPDLEPLVARGLALTAAAKFRELGIAATPLDGNSKPANEPQGATPFRHANYEQNTQ